MISSANKWPYASLAVASTLGAAMAVSFALRRRKRRRLQRSHPYNEQLSSIRGNSRATGTQLVSIYSNHYHCSTTVSSEGKEQEQLSLYVITGATSGLGLQTAQHLASLPSAYLILGCRNVSLGGKAADELNNSGCDDNAGIVKSSETTTLDRAVCIHLDLTSFASVRTFATAVIATSKQLGVPIHGLINNAGVYSLPGMTADGYQLTFQTNTLSPALLTELLLPHTTRDFRVVNVSSEMMRMVWNSPWKKGRAFPPIVGGGSDWDYALSKACQGLHAHELSVRFARDIDATTNTNMKNQPRAFAVEPGIVKTSISRHLRSWARKINYLIFAPIVRTVDEGTATILFCLLAPEEHLDFGWPASKEEDGDKCVAKPFYYANCMAQLPPRCCRRREDAELQGRVFRGVL